MRLHAEEGPCQATRFSALGAGDFRRTIEGSHSPAKEGRRYGDLPAVAYCLRALRLA